MKIETETYKEACESIPVSGQRIIGYQKENYIVVYQAYKPSIAAWAVDHQCLGGNEYSYNRMSWIKPNFLWMMYRCGWAEKENQERVLALWIEKDTLEWVMERAVISSYNPQYHASHEEWKHQLDNKEVRLQWDPDHDPYGNKLTRRAIQLGLKGEALKVFGKERIRLVEDITGFVLEQKQYLDSRAAVGDLQIPVERVLDFGNEELKKRIGID